MDIKWKYAISIFIWKKKKQWSTNSYLSHSTIFVVVKVCNFKEGILISMFEAWIMRSHQVLTPLTHCSATKYNWFPNNNKHDLGGILNTNPKRVICEVWLRIVLVGLECDVTMKRSLFLGVWRNERMNDIFHEEIFFFWQLLRRAYWIISL